MIYKSCRYMINDYKERRRLIDVAHVSNFIYELDLMTLICS